MQLRNYRPEDFEALWALDQTCFPRDIAYTREELAGFLQMRSAFAFIAESDGQGAPVVAGFIIAQRTHAHAGHIITIDVSPAARRNGVGTLLLEAAHERLWNLGCRLVHLETAVDNTAALAFYRQHGYTILATIPRYYESSGIDAFHMMRQLEGQAPAGK